MTTAPKPQDIHADDPDLLLDQARQLIDRKQYERALDCFEKAAALAPDDMSIACNIAEMLTALRRHDEAVAAFGTILEKDPTVWPAQNGLARIAKQQGAIADAIALYQDVLNRDPGNAQAAVGLADLMGRGGEIEAALAMLERAVEAHPRNRDVWWAYGDLQVALGRYTDAIESFRRAERIDPTASETNARLAVASKGLGELDQAITYFERALELWPTNWRIHLGLATIYLAKGDLAKGWRMLEWRHKSDAALAHLQPQWNGQDLEGRTAFLTGEGTIADEVMFASCLSEFAEGCGRCIVECQPPLVGLFTRSFPTVEVHGSVPPPDRPPPEERYDWLKPLGPVDVYSAIGNLARFLRPAIDAFPDPRPYLTPDPDLTALWRDRLADMERAFKIGLWWNGFAPAIAEQGLMMRDLLDAFNRDDVEFIVLAGDVPRHFPDGVDGPWKDRLSIVEGIDPAVDADEPAALMANLDLMVVPPGLVANLAGALDVPAFVPGPSDDWARLGTGRMPWFRSMELFTRRGEEPWTAVLTKLAEAVHKAADAKTR